MQQITLKTCSHCELPKPLTSFSRGAGYKDGIRSWCRKCCSETTIAGRRKKPRHYTETYTTWRYSLTGFLSRMNTNAKNQCGKRGLTYFLPQGYLPHLWEMQGGKCAVSGAPMQHTPTDSAGRRCNDYAASLDRVDSSKGYTPDNVRLVCWFVNDMKGDRSDAEFLSLIRLVNEAMPKA